MTEEVWKVVDGFPNYEVSNLGNIRNKERLLNPTFDTDGYRHINLYRRDGLGWRGRGRYMRKIYRLVLEAFTEPDPDPDKNQIDHINRIRSDDRLENLRWVSCRENNMNRGRPTEMTGINWDEKKQTYRVRGYKGVGKGQVYLGCRKDLDEAKKLRDLYYSNTDDKIYTVGKVEAREMRGISFNKKSNSYSIRVYQGKNKEQLRLGTYKDLDEAKKIRDNYYITKHNEDN